MLSTAKIGNIQQNHALIHNYNLHTENATINNSSTDQNDQKMAIISGSCDNYIKIDSQILLDSTDKMKFLSKDSNTKPTVTKENKEVASKNITEDVMVENVKEFNGSHFLQ